MQKVVLTALFIGLTSSVSCPFVTLDFDVSMQAHRYPDVIASHKNKAQMGITGQDLMLFFKELYEKNNMAHIRSCSTLKIPKIIHQIWIGTSVPVEFEQFQASWRKHHPEWEYRLWTQHDIPGLHMHNEDLVRQSKNPAEVSDLMRYEILYQYGGVYLDFDCECLQSLDALHYVYDFYIGIQPLDSGLVQLGIGIIGSIAGHPLLKKCIEGLRGSWNNIKDNVAARTGPIYCTKIFYEYAAQDDLRTIAFPATYFYPLGSTQNDLEKDAWINQGSFAVHHWAKSWLLPSFRKPEFRTIKNY